MPQIRNASARRTDIRSWLSHFVTSGRYATQGSSFSLYFYYHPRNPGDFTLSRQDTLSDTIEALTSLRSIEQVKMVGHMHHRIIVVAYWTPAIQNDTQSTLAARAEHC